MTAFSVNAQVKVVSPHPDLGIKITRCAYADGLVIVDLVATNFGTDTEVIFKAGSFYGHVIEDSGSAYDDEGNLYDNTNSEFKIGVANKALNWSQTVFMPQDVPIRMRFQAPKISDLASKFALLKLCVFSRGMGLEDKFIQIRVYAQK